MKRNELFVTHQIEKSLYLLPVGQMIADYNRGIRMNETCFFVWDQLKNEISFDELMDRCNDYFEPENDDEKESLRADISGLIGSFQDRGMLEGSKNIFKCDCNICRSGASLPKPGFLEATDETALFDSFENHSLASDKKNISDHKEIPSQGHYGTFEIGGLSVEMYGDTEYFDELFENFRIDEKVKENIKDSAKENKNGKMKICVLNIDEQLINTDDGYYDENDINKAETLTGDKPAPVKAEELKEDCFGKTKSGISKEENTGKIIVHNNELTVMEYNSLYVLFYNELEGIEELHLAKDGSRAVFYCSSPNTELRENLFYAIRIPFLIYALENDRVMLHSCSILYEDKIWAFSAPSGTGKSTHCALWNKLYDVKTINGDLNLLGMENGEPYVYGTPWCGTSGVFDTLPHKLGGIVLLKQYPENWLEELSDEKKILLIQQRLITSVWDERMLKKTFDIVTQIVKCIYIKRYHCTKEDDAAEYLRKDIDRFLSNNG